MVGGTLKLVPDVFCPRGRSVSDGAEAELDSFATIAAAAAATVAAAKELEAFA
jgi:hypothetical protein